jgi:hypothetical protein
MELQSSPVYQGLVAAQSNFDKLLTRVNEEISRAWRRARSPASSCLPETSMPSLESLRGASTASSTR